MQVSLGDGRSIEVDGAGYIMDVLRKAALDDDKHPRGGKGTAQGGKFVSKGSAPTESDHQAIAKHIAFSWDDTPLCGAAIDPADLDRSVVDERDDATRARHAKGELCTACMNAWLPPGAQSVDDLEDDKQRGIADEAKGELDDMICQLDDLTLPAGFKGAAELEAAQKALAALRKKLT